jgi:hypothetical protein
VKKKLSALVIVVVIAAAVVVGVLMLQNRQAAEEKPGTAKSTSSVVTPEQVQTIVGRWRRPDGGYIIEIGGLDVAGNLDVAYYNPRPINVSQAQVVQSPKGLHIFIELRDKGYPGATYRLDYERDNDTMTGIYFQPSVNQSFDVVFVREQ